MITLIEKLVELGYAYGRASMAQGDMYFDTAKWSMYGELTHQKLDDMEGERSNPAKINPQDFALWKAAKSTEPESASWPSPFGSGPPRLAH